jgi:hypothetical protein
MWYNVNIFYPAPTDVGFVAAADVRLFARFETTGALGPTALGQRQRLFH